MTFPSIDPVAFSLGPVAIRWYALAYLAGFVLGWRLCMRLVRTRTTPPLPQNYDDFLTWAVIGTVLGGRLGYILFYNLPHYFEHPLDALMVWHGGMAFHGGMMGVILAAIIYTRKHKLAFWQFADPLAAVAPIGLFFGRLANFVNGELFGRVTDSPLGMVFPNGGDLPRHPSQIYQAGLEGLILFVVLMFLVKKSDWQNRPGLLSGVFLTGYSLARITGELFRQPDPQLGFLFAGATMGQLLSLPMIGVGVWLVWRTQTGGKNGLVKQ